MVILKSQARTSDLKPKRLRRDGFIPAVLYGKHLEESVLVKISQRDIYHFMKSNAVGSKLELDIDGEKHMAMLKEASYTPGTGKLEHLCFQALKADEKVKSVSRIILLGRESVENEGIIFQALDEIQYRALPSHIVEYTEVSVENMEIGQNITVADLDIAKNENIEILTALESVVATLSARKEHIIETVTDEDEEGDVEGEGDEQTEDDENADESSDD